MVEKNEEARNRVKPLFLSYELWFTVAVLLAVVVIEQKVFRDNGIMKLLFRMLKALFTIWLINLATGFSPGEVLIATITVTMLLYMVDIHREMIKTEK